MDPKDMICAALERGNEMTLDGFNCLPDRPSKTGKAIMFGIKTDFLNLFKFFKIKFETSFDYEGKIDMHQCMNLYSFSRSP